jgi:DNA-directed RNA polymerase subunit delta
MKKIIVDYKNLSSDLKKLLTEAYPHGLDEADMITYTNAKGELVETIKLETSDAIYLIKIGSKSTKQIMDYEEDLEDDDTPERDMDDADEVDEDYDD